MYDDVDIFGCTHRPRTRPAYLHKARLYSTAQPIQSATLECWLTSAENMLDEIAGIQIGLTGWKR
jgi:hypothetical protein